MATAQPPGRETRGDGGVHRRRRGAPGAARREAPRTVNPSGIAARGAERWSEPSNANEERSSSHRLRFVLPKQSRLDKNIYIRMFFPISSFPNLLQTSYRNTSLSYGPRKALSVSGCQNITVYLLLHKHLLAQFLISIGRLRSSSL